MSTKRQRCPHGGVEIDSIGRCRICARVRARSYRSIPGVSTPEVKKLRAIARTAEDPRRLREQPGAITVQELRKQRQAAGICVLCGGPRPCRCSRGTKDRYLAAGLCTHCGGPKPCPEVRNYQYKKRERLAGRPMPVMCELCKIRPARVWDHDHETGVFRGWLCDACNTLAQHPDRLRQVLDYVLRGGIGPSVS